MEVSNLELKKRILNLNMELFSILKNHKIYLCFIIYYILSFIYLSNSHAQSNPEHSVYSSKFEILRSQINLFGSYILLTSTQLNLLSEADSLGLTGEYEIGLIYLEELLQSINLKKESANVENGEIGQWDRSKNDYSTKDFSMSIITGIDFDKHEFEYGYETSDSTILEELNKPYAGLSIDYIMHNSKENNLNLYNSIRYDNENLRDDYQINFRHKNLNIRYGGYLNKSTNSIYSSYWENNFQFTFSEYLFEKTKISFRNNYNYKTFDKSDFNYTDYYRNYFESNIEYQNFNFDLYSQYKNEINEFLGNNNNDYKQNTLKIGYRNMNDWDFRHSASIDYEIRNYELFYGDSTISNVYNQLALIIDLDFKIYKSLSLQFANHLVKKIYNFQSTFEPDYVWNYFRPSVEVDINSLIQVGIGYEWEIKSHTKIEEDAIESTEQNYNSNGLFSSLNYFSKDGLNFSFSMSYQWRRYPESPTNDLINLYSSRNVLSLIALGNFPLTNNFGINVLAVYDNDKDIDNDQGKTQSSIYNIELEYKF